MTDQNHQTEETTDAPQEHEQPRQEASSAGAGSQAGEDRPDEVGSRDGADLSRDERRDQRWRERAQSAEGRLERMVRAEVLRLLGERVSDPEAALTLSGAPMGDLLTGDGDVDPDAVAALAERTVQQRPYLRPPAHHGDLGPKRAVPQGNRATWGRLLKGG